MSISKVQDVGECENISSQERGYWDIENTIADSFNRLKAKLYNLIEASIENETQQKALKGLIKGFSNEEYKECTRSTKVIANVYDILPRSDFLPVGEEPLENK